MMSRRYAVIGNPVRHSLSPWIHDCFARQTQRDLVYAAYAPEAEDLESFLGGFFAAGGGGLNVTVPYKAAAAQWADKQSGLAARLGVANVLSQRGGRVVAYNTDGAGFLSDALPRLPDGGMTDRRVVLLGAGGAARAVGYAVSRQQPARFMIFNRTRARAEELAALIGAGATVVDAYPDDAEVVINATAAGLSGEAQTLPPSLFAKALLAYDLSYGAAAQSFLRQARQGGAAEAVDGLGMLLWQAALSFALWEGVMPSVAPLLRALRGRV